MKNAEEIREMMPRPHEDLAAKIMPLIEDAASKGHNVLHEHMCGDIAPHMVRDDRLLAMSPAGADGIYDLGTFFEKHGFNVKMVPSVSLPGRRALFLEISWPG